MSSLMTRNRANLIIPWLGTIIAPFIAQNSSATILGNIFQTTIGSWTSSSSNSYVLKLPLLRFSAFLIKKRKKLISLEIIYQCVCICSFLGSVLQVNAHCVSQGHGPPQCEQTNNTGAALRVKASHIPCGCRCYGRLLLLSNCVTCRSARPRRVVQQSNKNTLVPSST